LNLLLFLLYKAQQGKIVLKKVVENLLISGSVKFGINCEEREREKPTRCNNQMFIINTFSTCFGHHYAHLQENKDRVLLHVVCCAASTGCGW